MCHWWSLNWFIFHNQIKLRFTTKRIEYFADAGNFVEVFERLSMIYFFVFDDKCDELIWCFLWLIPRVFCWWIVLMLFVVNTKSFWKIVIPRAFAHCAARRPIGPAPITRTWISQLRYLGSPIIGFPDQN